jgi:signal transduction histidine kinase
MRRSLGPNLPQKFFTPLASILGLAELLRAGLDTQSKAEMRQDLQDIERAARQLHRMLRNHLLLLAGEPKRDDAPLAPIGAEEVRLALTNGSRVAAARHDRTADLTLELTGCSLRATMADLGVLAEELCDNACSFSSKGTAVRVRAWAEGAVFQCTVADVGRGLTPLQVAQIRSLNQADRGQLEEAGLGIGLTLVRRIVARLGGEFALESEAGQGTTCRFSLPLYRGSGS